MNHVTIIIKMISEAAHRAGYDLSQWQSIAKLLSDARSKILPEEYKTFYNAVTAYSRSRGTDSDALRYIEGVLTGWTADTKQVVSQEITTKEPGATDTEADDVLAAAMQDVKSEPEIIETPRSPVVHDEEKSMPAVSPVVSEKEPEPQRIMTIDEAKARILVIKNEIHELIGNPVALIGDMGTLGKDYMAALLRATRATMGGAGGGVMPAMYALERAYEKLRTSAMTGERPEEEVVTAELLVESEGLKEESEVTPAVSEALVMEASSEESEQEKSHLAQLPQQEEETLPSLPTSELETETFIEESAPEVAQEEVKSEPLPELVVDRTLREEVIPETEAVKEIESTPEKEVAAEEVVEIPQEQVVYKEVVQHEDRDSNDEIENLRKKLALLELQMQEKKPAPVPVVVENISRKVAPEPKPEKKVSEEVPPVSAQRHAVLPKVAQRETFIQKPLAPRVASELRPISGAHTTALFTIDHAGKEKMYESEAVTDGLRSLLMSWEIFRGGFLSGKERGIAHPLYKTMQGVVMSDVLAGKFEGAKTSTVISVNDYVNAWRFEQGVEFNPVETFEHYLRRVIYRILTRAGEIA